MRRIMLSMLAVVATVGSLVLLGCPGDSDLHNPATPSDLNNKSFTFASGSAFNSALTNVSTVVSFSNNATNFALQATVQNVMRTATGTYDFDSCTLTVGSSTNPTAGGSDFPAGTGPQPNDITDFSICVFDTTNNSLTFFAGTTTTTGFLVQ